MAGKKGILTPNIILLSLVSLFNDIASEMLYPILPLYLASCGFGALWIGTLEGFAEVISGFSKSYFGRLSDQEQSRMPFVRAGYFLSAVSKPLLVLYRFAPWVLLMRTADRFGKGLRVGARDAMLADESDKAHRGKVFGFHRAMDTLGAIIGPSIALYWLLSFGFNGIDHFFWIAAIPGGIGLLFTFFVREKKKKEAPKGSRVPFFSFTAYWKKATPEYKRVFKGLMLFFLFNSSDAFLILMTQRFGMNAAGTVMLYILYNCSYAFFAIPAGHLADRIGMKKVLLSGLLLFALVYGMIGAMHLLQPEPVMTIAIFVAAFILYGFYAALTDGVSKAWLSKTTERTDTGEALGFYAGMQSIAALVASLTAGAIWASNEVTGPGLSFFITAGAALLAFTYLFRAPETR